MIPEWISDSLHRNVEVRNLLLNDAYFRAVIDSLAHIPAGEPIDKYLFGCVVALAKARRATMAEVIAHNLVCPVVKSAAPNPWHGKLGVRADEPMIVEGK